MSVYMTEQEQLEVIKNWWKRHSSTITVVLSVFLLAFSGYKYWFWHQEKINQQASNTYEHLMIAFSNQDNKSVRAFANQLIKEHGKTVYSDAARLTLAKLYVTNSKIKQAEEHLSYVSNHSNVTALKQIAKIRLARLLVSEKQFDKALNELNTVVDTAYISSINEIKGDIYTAKGNYAQAIDSYRKAVTDIKGLGMGNLFLEMKTNELTALTQKMTTNNQTAQAA